MKTTWSGKVKVAAARVVAIAAKATAPPAWSREAEEELRRRAEINARGDAARAEWDQALFGASGWLGRRPRWLDRRR